MAEAGKPVNFGWDSLGIFCVQSGGKTGTEGKEGKFQGIRFIQKL